MVEQNKSRMKDNKSISYSTTIDNLKGVLLLFVIVGHILLGSLQENPIRFFIYAFHMPLFFFVSGYLFNNETISSLSWSQIIKKYWKRMIQSWCVAFLVYSALSLRTPISVASVRNLLINPYYHLWYVPSLFIMVCIAIGFTKLHFRKLLWLIGGLFFILGTQVKLPDICRVTFFVYFLLGIELRQHNLSRMPKSVMGGGILLIYSTILFAFFGVSRDSVFPYYLMIMLPLNVLICIIATAAIQKKSFNKQGVLSYIGKNSLAIYLWHVLPIMIFKALHLTDIIYYLICFGLLFLFVVT